MLSGCFYFMQIYNLNTIKISKTIVESVPCILQEISKTIEFLENKKQLNNLVIFDLIKDLNNHKWVLEKQLDLANKCLYSKGRVR